MGYVRESLAVYLCCAISSRVNSFFLHFNYIFLTEVKREFAKLVKIYTCKKGVQRFVQDYITTINKGACVLTR